MSTTEVIHMRWIILEEKRPCTLFLRGKKKGRFSLAHEARFAKQVVVAVESTKILALKRTHFVTKDAIFD